MSIPNPSVLLRDPNSGAWRLFDAPLRTLVASRPDEVPGVLDQVEESTAREELWAVGWVSYEAAPGFDSALTTKSDPEFPAAWFGLFRPPRTVPSIPGTTPAGPIDWSAELTEAEYTARIAEVRRQLERGATYQANLSFRLSAASPSRPLDLFAAMVAVQQGGYAAYLDAGRWVVCSASPELFFLREGSRIVSKPMKGTSDPGRWPEEGRGLEAALSPFPSSSFS